MLRIDCPICGQRDETEFTYGGDASVSRPEMHVTQPKLWLDYVFNRDNPCGDHLEYWQHTLGCRQWLVVDRNTLTHDIRATRLAKEVTRLAREVA